jgi:hypothetical protein
MKDEIQFKNITYTFISSMKYSSFRKKNWHENSILSCGSFDNFLNFLSFLYTYINLVIITLRKIVTLKIVIE